MEKESDKRLHKREVTKTFCGSLKDEQKDKCVQFYEELFPEDQNKSNPDEKWKK